MALKELFTVRKRRNQEFLSRGFSVDQIASDEFREGSDGPTSPNMDLVQKPMSHLEISIILLFNSQIHDLLTETKSKEKVKIINVATAAKDTKKYPQYSHYAWDGSKFNVCFN